VVGLFVGGFVGAVLVLYAVDRILKARAQARRLRRMSERLAAAAARSEEQQEQRQAAAHASAALTSVMPAIQRPPLSLPGLPSHRPERHKTGRQHTGPHNRGSAHPERRPADRPGVTDGRRIRGTPSR
jgi:hypothetical protein